MLTRYLNLFKGWTTPIILLNFNFYNLKLLNSVSFKINNRKRISQLWQCTFSLEDYQIVLRIQNLLDFVHFKINSDNTVYNIKRCFDIQKRMFHLKRFLIKYKERFLQKQNLLLQYWANVNRGHLDKAKLSKYGTLLMQVVEIVTEKRCP